MFPNHHARRWIPVLVGILAGCTSSPGADRPNVIVIMTDDQGYGDFGSTGNPIIRTPHLDAIAARGAQMSTFYVSPVCSPTRASLLTGRYNFRTGVIDTWHGMSLMDPREVTMAEILRDAGYRTGIFGKWHLGDNTPMRPQDQGFEESLVHRGGGIGQPSDPPGGEGKYTDAILFHRGETVQTSGYVTDVYFDYAMRWIEEAHGSGVPFFAYIPTNAPHSPLADVPQDLYESYLREDLGSDRLSGGVGNPLPDQLNEDAIARVYSMITNIDDNVGRLFERLDALGITDNTLVIFFSDNGAAGPRYNAGLWGLKTSVWEGGVRSPLFMHWPARLPSGGSSDEVVAHIDILPTVLDAVGLSSDGRRLDGRSFLPLLTNEAAEWSDRPIVIQAHRGSVPQRYHNFMIREGRWKLVHASGFGRESFEGDPTFRPFDLEADPFEEFDLSADSREVVTRLRRSYDAWFDDVGGDNPENFEFLRVTVGTARESPTVLTRNDWHPTESRSFNDPLANGYWALRVAATGRFDVRVSFPVSFDGGRVTLRLNGDERASEWQSGAGTYLFEQVLLEGGRVDLQVTVDDGESVAGAWQVEVTRRSGENGR